MQITEDRRKRVIDLYFNQHKTYAEIAEIEKMSPMDIHAIIKEEEARRQKHKDQELSAEAYKLFSEGKTTVEVAIELNLREPEVTKLYREYWRLKGLHKLNLIFKETNGKLGAFLKLYRELIKEKGMSIEQVFNAVDTAIHKLPYMENLYRQAKDQAEKMQRTIQRLVNHIMALEHKISILDKTAFSIEQECRRKHQEIQELTDKKDRMEKLIANILNDNEGYSNLKQIVKENIKAVLAENKQVISISFAALIQTLKAEPEMVNLIYNMSATPHISRHDNKNDNNITKCLELNKVRILDLSEKNYENIVEALTNESIANASSNPTLSLPSTSSTFSDPLDQNGTYRKEEPEGFHNSEGDIAE